MEVLAMPFRTKITNLAKSFGQSVLAMSFNLAGMLAGTLLVIHLDVFSITPWALALFPGIISVRGVIEGLFSGRLTTALHVGTVKASYTGNTRYFYLLLYAIAALTIETSVGVGLAASLLGMFFWRTTFTDMVAILAVTIATMGLLMILASPITVWVSILSFKRGLDPDVIVYPVMSTTSDVIVTSCYILVLNTFFLLTPLGKYLIALFDVTFLLIVLYVSIKNYREAEFSKTIKEFFLTLFLVTSIVNVTGLVLGKISGVIGRRSEVYVVYPALIDTVGDVGSIVGSTATTKLTLGLIGSSFSSIKQHLTEIWGAWTASLTMFTVYSIISSLTQGITALSDIMKFMVQLLATNILAVSCVVLVAYAAAILTYRRGWDPDNFVIPIESSLADSITTISLFMALTATA